MHSFTTAYALQGADPRTIMHFLFGMAALLGALGSFELCMRMVIEHELSRAFLALFSCIVLIASAVFFLREGYESQERITRWEDDDFETV